MRGVATLVVLALTMLAAPEGAWTHPAEQHASGEEAAFQLEGGNGQLSENTPGFLEREGNMVPMDTEFTTSDGETVTLAELAGNGERPLVLNLQYYDCPNLCGQILIDQAETLSQVSRVAGEDYQLVTLSIAPNETPELAAEIKNRTLGMLESAFPEEGWSFLTGDKGNIDRVAESIGFQYRRKGESYAHPMGLVFVSPHGKVTRYVHGLDYLPAVVNMSIMEATTGTVQPAVAKVLQLCFQTSPEGNTIAFKAKQVTGAVTITFASVFGLFLFRRGRIRRRTYGPDSEEEQS